MSRSLAYEPVEEFCRHWVKSKANRCAQPAIIIVWGKLAKPGEMGPMCRDHVPDWCELGRLDQYAVFDLRDLRRRMFVEIHDPAYDGPQAGA